MRHSVGSYAKEITKHTFCQHPKKNAKNVNSFLVCKQEDSLAVTLLVTSCHFALPQFVKNK